MRRRPGSPFRRPSATAASSPSSAACACGRTRYAAATTCRRTLPRAASAGRGGAGAAAHPARRCTAAPDRAALRAVTEAVAPRQRAIGFAPIARCRVMVVPTEAADTALRIAAEAHAPAHDGAAARLPCAGRSPERTAAARAHAPERARLAVPHGATARLRTRAGVHASDQPRRAAPGASAACAPAGAAAEPAALATRPAGSTPGQWSRSAWVGKTPCTRTRPAGSTPGQWSRSAWAGKSPCTRARPADSTPGQWSQSAWAGRSPCTRTRPADSTPGQRSRSAWAGKSPCTSAALRCRRPPCRTCITPVARRDAPQAGMVGLDPAPSAHGWPGADGRNRDKSGHDGWNRMAKRRHSPASQPTRRNLQHSKTRRP